MQHADQPAITVRPALSREGGAPTARFRRESWAEVQRLLDPLGQPRPLRSAKHPALRDLSSRAV